MDTPESLPPRFRFHKLIAGVVASALAFFSATTRAEDHWKLVRNEDGIKVFTQGVSGSDYVEFKGETVLNANLQECTGLLMSVPHMSKWMYGTVEAKLVSSTSPLDRVLYLVQHVPFPLRDRDGFVRNVLSQRADNSVVYTMELIPKKEIDSKYVHLDALKVQVTLKPLSATETFVEYRAHVDPGGVVPAWAANKIVVDTPFETLKDGKELLKTTKQKLLLTAVRNQS